MEKKKAELKLLSRNSNSEEASKQQLEQEINKFEVNLMFFEYLNFLESN